METILIDCDVKIVRPLDEWKRKWVGSIGKIVTLFISDRGMPIYTIMFENESKGTGTLVNFYHTEFVVVLMGDGDEDN